MIFWDYNDNTRTLQHEINKVYIRLGELFSDDSEEAQPEEMPMNNNNAESVSENDSNSTESECDF